MPAVFPDLIDSACRVAYLEEPNNFSHALQTINEQPILAATFSPNEPTIYPHRPGHVHVQIAEGTGTDNVRVWFAIGTTPGEAVWEELKTNVVPDDVVRTNKENDFNNVKQTIGTNQIVTIRDGGVHHLPTDPVTDVPDFDGQLYFSYNEDKTDVAMWVAKDRTWMPMKIDMANIAQLNVMNRFKEINIFEEPMQMLGKEDKGRLIAGTRVKQGGQSPAFDPDWPAEFQGERCIWVNTGVDPVECSLWEAVAPQGSGWAWRMTWTSKHTDLDLKDYAKVKEVNQFQFGQKMGVYQSEGSTITYTNSANVAAVKVTDEDPNGKIMPFMKGQFVFAIIPPTPGTGQSLKQQLYVSVDNKVDAWELMFDSEDSVAGLDSRVTQIESELANQVAKLKKVNEFVPGQRVVKKDEVGKAEEFGLIPMLTMNTSDPTDAKVPMQMGHMHLQSTLEDSIQVKRLFLNTSNDDPDHWYKIFDSNYDLASVGERLIEAEADIVNLQGSVEFNSDEVKRLKDTVYGPEGGVAGLEDKVEALDEKVHNAEGHITTLTKGLDDTNASVGRAFDRIEQIEEAKGAGTYTLDKIKDVFENPNTTPNFLLERIKKIWYELYCSTFPKHVDPPPSFTHWDDMKWFDDYKYLIYKVNSIYGGRSRIDDEGNYGEHQKGRIDLIEEHFEEGGQFHVLHGEHQGHKTTISALQGSLEALQDVVDEKATVVQHDALEGRVDTLQSELGGKFSASGGTVSGLTTFSGENELLKLHKPSLTVGWTQSIDSSGKLVLTGTNTNTAPNSVDSFLFGRFDNNSMVDLKEKGERVYSPNNKPTPADIGAITESRVQELINASQYVLPEDVVKDSDLDAYDTATEVDAKLELKATKEELNALKAEHDTLKTQFDELKALVESLSVYRLRLNQPEES